MVRSTTIRAPSPPVMSRRTLHFYEVDKTMLHIGPHQLRARVCRQRATPALPASAIPPCWGCKTRRNVPFGVLPCDHGVKSFAYPMAHRQSGHPLRHFALHFSRGIALLGTVPRRWPARDRCRNKVRVFHPALL